MLIAARCTRLYEVCKEKGICYEQWMIMIFDPSLIHIFITVMTMFIVQHNPQQLLRKKSFKEPVRIQIGELSMLITFLKEQFSSLHYSESLGLIY